jgi:hypothetical protein
MGLRYFNSLMRVRDLGLKKFGSGIRDGKNSDPVSGINIPDPQHWAKHKGKKKRKKGQKWSPNASTISFFQRVKENI